MRAVDAARAAGVDGARASARAVPEVGGSSRALVALVRSTLAGRLGVRAARSAGILVAVYFVGLAWLLGRRWDDGGGTSGIAARGVALVAIYAGALAALSLSYTPKSTELDDAVRALAGAHGFSSRAVALAETKASVRLGIEVVAWPSVGLALACFVSSPAHSPGAVVPIAGAAVFGGVAGAVAGAVSAACRRAFGPRGRTALLAIVLVPWIAAEALVGGAAADFLSIPGWLSFAWRVLTRGAS